MNILQPSILKKHMNYLITGKKNKNEGKKKREENKKGTRPIIIKYYSFL